MTELGNVVVEINGEEVTFNGAAKLKDILAEDVQALEQLNEDRKLTNQSYRDVAKPIKKRLTEFSKAIKAGCETPADFNQWKLGEWHG